MAMDQVQLEEVLKQMDLKTAEDLAFAFTTMDEA